MSPNGIPVELGGLPVFAACPEDRYLPLSRGDGMGAPESDEFWRFRSVAVCPDAQSGGVFVFKCVAGWEAVADDWYDGLDAALAGLEDEYPGIGQALVRVGSDA